MFKGIISIPKLYIRRDTNRWSIFTLIIVCFVAIPVITIAIKLLMGPGESWGHIVDNVLLDYSLNTLFLSVGCIILTGFFGISAAWIVSRYNIPLGKTLEWMLILPLAMPSYITAYAYAGLFDYGGTFQYILESIGLPAAKLNVMNIYGLIVVLSVSLFPYVYVSARAVFLYQSNRLIEASKMLGAGETKTFFTIILPIARPAIVGGLILVIMEVLNDYGAAKYYGVSTFTTGIFRSWFSLAEPATAVFLSALLLLVVFLLLYFESKQRGNKGYATLTKSAVQLPKLKVSKRRAFFLSSIASIPVILGFMIPVGQLCYWAVLTYAEVLNASFFKIALQSLGIAVITGVITVFFALLILYIPKWNRLKILKKSSRIAILGYAIPGAVIAIGIMIPTLALDKWLIKMSSHLFNIELGLLINGTIFILIYAYVIRFMAVAFNPLKGSSIKISEGLAESSQLLGAGKLKTFLKIELPLLKTGLFSAFILVFVDAMKELPLTLILKPYDVNTLAVKAYEFASDELILESSIPSLFIIATGVIPIIVLNRLILK
ncbi:ABC transporter permease [Patiriisocius sp. Uisw_017]|jgi:iron(III) transport system permease protein|uniref:ABC transporter permease n=1 Tax=Patiriisocius sp. Uisw_017 TaxID=3230968 RepID=UPI0039E8B1AC